MTKRTDQVKHQRIIKRLAKHLRSKGYLQVRADIPNMDSPTEINWKGDERKYVPDLSAVNRGKRYLFEVETDDSINDKHTRMQWRVFAAYAYQKNASFIVVVPGGSAEKAGKRLKELSLPGKVLEL